MQRGVHAVVLTAMDVIGTTAVVDVAARVEQRVGDETERKPSWHARGMEPLRAQPLSNVEDGFGRRGGKGARDEGAHGDGDSASFAQGRWLRRRCGAGPQPS